MEEENKITAEPGKVANMRDGNCLFRAFSCFILFVIQSFHKRVRETLVSLMEENKILFAKV